MSRAATPLLRRELRPPAEAPELRLVGLPEQISESQGRALARALRPYQWAKNLLVFAPLLLAHQVDDGTKWGALAIAFALFSATASAVYLFNDLIDLQADRRHPVKCCRPLAAGTLPVPLAVLCLVGLAGGSLLVSAVVMPRMFTGMLAAYLAGTTAYTLYLKRTLILDVLLLAGLYTHRIVCGGIVADVEISPWLMSFSTFLFLSLALLKRYLELRRQTSDSLRERRRSYVPEDADLLQNLGLIAGYLSVLVLCLYLSSNVVERLYHHPAVLWLIAPLLLYWISRTWLLARRGAVAEDPLVAALRDPRSYLVGVGCAILLVIASV